MRSVRITALLCLSVPIACASASVLPRKASSAGTQVIATPTQSEGALAPTPTFTTASSKGWTIYHDAKVPFELAIPPGWRTGAYTDDSSGHGFVCVYVVMLFPPGSQAVARLGALESTPEYMSIQVMLDCPRIDGFVPTYSVVTISGSPGRLYVGDYNHDVLALVDFGEHQYVFTLNAPPEQAIPLYVAMLASFHYRGS